MQHPMVVQALLDNAGADSFNTVVLTILISSALGLIYLFFVPLGPAARFQYIFWECSTRNNKIVNWSVFFIPFIGLLSLGGEYEFDAKRLDEMPVFTAKLESFEYGRGRGAPPSTLNYSIDGLKYSLNARINEQSGGDILKSTPKGTPIDIRVYLITSDYLIKPMVAEIKLDGNVIYTLRHSYEERLEEFQKQARHVGLGFFLLIWGIALFFFLRPMKKINLLD